MKIKYSYLVLIICLLQLGGCATPKNPSDPLEPYNRKVFGFNYALDKALFRPVAKGYNKLVPTKVQAHVTYFFNNLDAIPSVANDVLQLDFPHALSDTGRFAINSTVGILGFFDVATSRMNLPYHHNDLGLTFARWGMVNSPYFMIPFLGPSTLRDAVGTLGNTYMSVWPYIRPTWASWTVYGIEKVHYRAALLPTDQLVDQAFDPYIFVRDAYLQNRQADINRVRKIKVDQDNNVNNNQDTFVSGTDENNQKNNNKHVPAVNDSKDTFVPA